MRAGSRGRTGSSTPAPSGGPPRRRPPPAASACHPPWPPPACPGSTCPTRRGSAARVSSCLWSESACNDATLPQRTLLLQCFENPQAPKQCHQLCWAGPASAARISPCMPRPRAWACALQTVPAGTGSPLKQPHCATLCRSFRTESSTKTIVTDSTCKRYLSGT